MACEERRAAIGLSGILLIYLLCQQSSKKTKKLLATNTKI